ncbi:MAG: hypothetical protein E4H46_02630 [Desulfobacterales bacterium]|nr:MAG: hypothetical protein E4H46_02630 [Desulfobacterales bacterium]
MKIRQKITLWISATTLIAAVSFSTFVFLEMIEQPYYLIDTELKHMAEALFGQYRNNPDHPLTVDEKSLPNPPDKYWIRISDSSGAIFFASSMTRRNWQSRYWKIIGRCWLHQLFPWKPAMMRNCMSRGIGKNCAVC